VCEDHHRHRDQSQTTLQRPLGLRHAAARNGKYQRYNYNSDSFSNESFKDLKIPIPSQEGDKYDSLIRSLECWQYKLLKITNGGTRHHCQYNGFIMLSPRDRIAVIDFWRTLKTVQNTTGVAWVPATSEYPAFYVL